MLQSVHSLDQQPLGVACEIFKARFHCPCHLLSRRLDDLGAASAILLLLRQYHSALHEYADETLQAQRISSLLFSCWCKLHPAQQPLPHNRFELLDEVFSVGPSLGQICLRFVFYRYFDDFAHDGYAAKDRYGGRQAQPTWRLQSLLSRNPFV